MAFDPGLEPGAVLNNKQISALFGCSIEGGIRKSKRNNCLVLIVNYTKPNHTDHWNGDILHFGGRGDNLDTWQNRSLSQAEANGMPLFLFELERQGAYVYAGKVRVVGDPVIEETDGRREVVFNLKKVKARL